MPKGQLSRVPWPEKFWMPFTFQPVFGQSAASQTFTLTPASYTHSTSTSLHSTRSKKFSPKNKKDLGMACHIPPLKEAKKQGEMPLPSLGPIPLKSKDLATHGFQKKCMLSLLTSGLESFGHKSTPSDRPWIEAYVQHSS